MPSRQPILCLASAALAMSVLGACGRAEPPPRTALAFEPPSTARGTDVETMHGERVADPYRWLEALGAAEVDAWVAAQDHASRAVLERLPMRRRLIERLTRLWDHPRVGLPLEAGGRYFLTRNDGLQAQDSLWVFDRWGDAPRLLVDPDAATGDGSAALGGYAPSPDGALLAYSVQDRGSDWRAWRVRDVVTGADLDDRLGFTKFTDVSWSRDGRGFYYSRYPVGPGPDYLADDQRPVAVWYHRVGSPQSDDRMVLDLGHASRSPYALATEDGAYLVIDVFDGYQSNALLVMRLDRLRPEPAPLADRWDALYRYLGNVGTTFYVHTTKDAPNGRVVAIDLAHPQPDRWREVVPESRDALEGASLVGGRLVLRYLSAVRSRVLVHGLDGRPQREVELPPMSSAIGFGGRAASTETFYLTEGFTAPPSLHRYDVASGAHRPVHRVELPIDLEPYVTEQVEFRSKDGTPVPMFVIRRRDQEADGSGAVLLQGYGGFAVSETPAFSVARAAWLELGGAVAIAALRGGGEFGETWHLAGVGPRKQNTFDDFIAAAEHLVASGRAAPDRIAIQGASNGGLLVGAVLNQRPDLFAAAVVEVGVLDMLRYHLASANARQWATDYGTAEDAAGFRALRAYSPYHNVRAGTCYPPTLIATGARDDRVVPWHSFKFAAALQAAQRAAPGCASPVMLRIDWSAGHGEGRTTAMRIEAAADQWAFLAWALRLGVTPSD